MSPCQYPLAIMAPSHADEWVMSTGSLSAQVSFNNEYQKDIKIN